MFQRFTRLSACGGVHRASSCSLAAPGTMVEMERRSRTTYQDRQAARHSLVFFGASFIVMTRMSRHSVVAPILAAPLLTDTRRLTVGPGTSEDLVVATLPVVAVLRSCLQHLRCHRLWCFRTCTLLRQCLPWTLRMWSLVTPRCGGLGQRLCPHPRCSDDVLGQWLSAFRTARNERQKRKPVGRRRSAGLSQAHNEG